MLNVQASHALCVQLVGSWIVRIVIGLVDLICSLLQSLDEGGVQMIELGLPTFEMRRFDKAELSLGVRIATLERGV